MLRKPHDSSHVLQLSVAQSGDVFRGLDPDRDGKIDRSELRPPAKAGR